MKIGFDFDGVISNCGKLKSDGAKKLYNVDILPAQFRKEVVVGSRLLTMEQYGELQKVIYGTREIGFLMEPVSGVLIYLPKLITEGHTVLVVTSRGNIGLEIAKEWSARQNLQLDFVGVGYGNSKANVLRGFDAYIDDDLDKLEPLAGIVPNLYLFSWDYNQHINAEGVVQRVFSWEELYRTIHALGGAR